MAKSILEIYDEQKAAIGVDKISFDAGVNAKTPYTTNDLKKADGLNNAKAEPLLREYCPK